jgi:hypothetical protein
MQELVGWALHLAETTPSVLLAWFVLCVVALGGFALQCLWLLVVQPLFAWLGRL